MRRNAPIYIWRKSANREWFPKHEASLDELAGGSLAVIERAGRKQLQFEACVSHAAASGLLQNFGGTMEKLSPDWLARFSPSKTAKPIRIGARLVIANGKREPASEGHSLYIPAGAAFGTGEHATTAMSLRILERLTRARPAGWRLFDAGTGSGILALAAARFGAKEIVAIDNDPTAIATARENARVNRISRSRFVTGDVRQPLRGRFDVIAANLYSELLIEMLPRFRRSIARDGRLVLSGVLRQQESGLVRSLRANCFWIEETRRRGKWVALVARLTPKTQLTRKRPKSTFPHP